MNVFTPMMYKTFITSTDKYDELSLVQLGDCSHI
jgi:hypothetical protein